MFSELTNDYANMTTGLCEIRDCHGNVCEDYCLLECDVLSGRSVLVFCSNMLLPQSR